MSMNKTKAKYIIRVLFSFPKIVFVNWKLFPARIAVKLPLFISLGTKVSGLKRNRIILDTQFYTGMISMGFWGTDGVIENRYTKLMFGERGCWHIKGKTVIAKGCSICVGGELFTGENLGVNKNSMISCNKRISIGNDVTTGWNIDIRDSDNHTVFFRGQKKQSEKEIIIGNHVWICANARILKGTVIKDDSVIAYNSCVTKPIDIDHVLIGGYPAKILQKDVSWKL